MRRRERPADSGRRSIRALAAILCAVALRGAFCRLADGIVPVDVKWVNESDLPFLDHAVGQVGLRTAARGRASFVLGTQRALATWTLCIYGDNGAACV